MLWSCVSLILKQKLYFVCERKVHTRGWRRVAGKWIKQEKQNQRKKESKVALSDCVHKAVVIVCCSSVGAPREASLARVMARRPHTLTGPPEYKGEATLSQGEGNIDARDHFFLRVFVMPGHHTGPQSWFGAASEPTFHPVSYPTWAGRNGRNGSAAILTA